MRRVALYSLILLTVGAGFATVAGADDTRTYEIEMFNAFGVVDGSDVRVSGVDVGTVQDLTINERKRAVVTVELSGDLAVLGEDTKCSSEPQSLIAEYFIDCEPAGDPLPDGGTVPAEQVEQTVQADLVQNTVREPYMVRFALLLNEFGTALAGNPETLNEAIRLGAPALTQLERATRILADQRRTIRDLNVNSNTIMAELAEQRDEVVRFIEEAGETAEISASRRADLSRQFNILDDFLAELDPTLASLEELAIEQTPLLHDLRRAAPGLNRLAQNLPPFNRASEPALRTLGEASQVGERALKKGRRPIELLSKAGRRAPRTTEIVADLLRDLDDPRRAVEIDERAGEDTGRTDKRPGRKDTMGYTGFEGLLNYVYYQALATNQFDSVGHLLHFGLYGANSGPCGEFSSGRDPDTGEPGVPAAGGGTTTDILEADRCLAWLGPNQPGVNEDLDLPKYDPSVCVDGTSPERAERELCTPADSSAGRRARAAGSGKRLQEIIEKEAEAIRPGGAEGDQSKPGGGGGGGSGPSGPSAPSGPLGLPEIPGLPGLNGLSGKGGAGIKGLRSNKRRDGKNKGNGKGGGSIEAGLFDYLFADR
jgi:virulence factor Mce-like protein